jgi:hypothetical protein
MLKFLKMMVAEDDHIMEEALVVLVAEEFSSREGSFAPRKKFRRI